jgi:hypothetical protein
MPRKKNPNPEPDPKTTEKLLGHLRKGVPRKYAAVACGISERTLSRYVAWGREGKSPKWVAFLAAIKNAESSSVCEHVANINKASKKVWQASAWMLERLYPEYFGSERREIAELKTQLAELSKQVSDIGASAKPTQTSQEPTQADSATSRPIDHSTAETTVRPVVDEDIPPALPEGGTEQTPPRSCE